MHNLPDFGSNLEWKLMRRLPQRCIFRPQKVTMRGLPLGYASQSLNKAVRSRFMKIIIIYHIHIHQ